MARSIHTFKDADLVAHAMGGKMVVVRDGSAFSLIIENAVAYTNDSLAGLVAFLDRTAKRGASSIMPKDCVDRLTVLIFKIKNA